jgi:hypothetical protein
MLDMSIQPRKHKVYVSKKFKHIKDIISHVSFVIFDDGSDNIDYAFGMTDDLPRYGLVVTKREYIENGAKILDAFYVECMYNNDHGEDIVFLRHRTNRPYFRSISFVVQGVDVETTAPWLCLLFMHGYIICSTWNTHGNFEQVKTHVVEKGIYNNQNVFYHNLSTLTGLKHVRTLFAIKVRADEVYANMLPVIQQVLSEKDTRKITTANIFIRPQSAFPFHLSDHIIGGRTEELRKMFLGAEQLIHNRVPFRGLAMFRESYWVPEQIFAIGYLFQYYPIYYLQSNNCATLMNKHFTSVDIHWLHPLRIIYTLWFVNNDCVKKRKVTVNQGNLFEHRDTLIDQESYLALKN